jgi:UrcA family protein
MLARTLSALAAAALTLATVAASSSAHAQVLEQQSVVVHFDDLDLTHPSGLARLETRVKMAVRSICASGGRDARAFQAERQCRAEALDKGRAQVAAVVSARSASQVALSR